MRDLSRLAGRIFNTPLAIWRPKMDAILYVLGPRLGLAELPVVQAGMLTVDQQERKPYQMTGDGIAVIDIEGTLVRKASGLDAWSGMSSYQDLEAEWCEAMEDPDVQGILCTFDSPGGEVGGLFDLVDKLQSMRGTKPVYGAVAEMACSAAYAIAAVCDQIFVSQTACVGSIGVWALHADLSEMDKKAGVKYTYIFAGDKKIDGNPHQPLSKEAHAEFQDEIDRTRELFVDSVAANRRGMTAKNVRAQEAGVFFGSEGVSEGLADKVGTVEDALAALRASVGSSGAKTPKGKRAMPAAAPRGGNESPEPELKSEAQLAAELAILSVRASDASAADSNKEATMAEDKNDADAKKKADDEQMKKDEDAKAKKKADDDQKKDEEDEAAKKAALAKEGNSMRSSAEIQEITELCDLAGLREQALDFITKGASVADVRKALVDERAKQSNAYVITGRHGNAPGRGMAALESQAREYSRSNRGSYEKAMARMLAADPQAYAEHRQDMIRRQRAFELGGGGFAGGGTFQSPGMMAAQPTQYDVHVNAPLSNISVAFIQEESAFVAADVFPNVPVLKQSDLYYQYTRADFNTAKFQQRSEDGSGARAGYRVSATNSYLCIVQALGKDIPDIVRANMDSVLSGDRDAAIWLTQQFLIKRELDFVNQFMTTGIWTNNTAGGATATGTLGAGGSTVVYWDNNASTPIEDVRNASRTMQTSSGGFRPTDLTLGRSVFDHLLDHPDIIDRVKYTGTEGSPAKGTKEILAELFEVDQVHVMDGVYNTAADGLTESNSLIGGKNALLSYRPRTPSLLVPSAGYTFSWTGLFGMGPMGTRMKTFREENKSKDVVEMEAAYAMKVVSADCGFFFSLVTQS